MLTKALPNLSYHNVTFIAWYQILVDPRLFNSFTNPPSCFTDNSYWASQLAVVKTQFNGYCPISSSMSQFLCGGVLDLKGFPLRVKAELLSIGAPDFVHTIKVPVRFVKYSCYTTNVDS
jgi:hypothetical protein